MPTRSGLSRSLRALHHALFHASREGRSAEIAAWSNGAASLGVGGALFYVSRSWPFALGVALTAFVLLRLALVHRVTVWIAGAFGTVAIAGLGGGLAWLFAHVIENAWAPTIAGVLAALASATVPASAYARFARRRAEAVRDSLVDPVSVPSSR